MPDGTPRAAVGLSVMLDTLEPLAAERASIVADRPMPVVPAAPSSGG